MRPLLTVPPLLAFGGSEVGHTDSIDRLLRPGAGVQLLEDEPTVPVRWGRGTGGELLRARSERWARDFVSKVRSRAIH